MKRPTLVVRNVLLDAEGRILLGLRTDLNKWEVSGGKVEDETVVQAGIREHREETGMKLCGTPVGVGYVDVVSEKKLGQRYVDVILLWKDWLEIPRVAEPHKHKTWKWFPLDEVPPPGHLMQSTRYIVERMIPQLQFQEEKVV